MPDAETAALAESLRAWCSSINREGLATPQTTALLTTAVCRWAEDQGWTPRLEVWGRISRPTRRGPRRARLDTVCDRPSGMRPIAIEIDHHGKVWSLQKLVAEAEAGSVALWLRWHGETRIPIPDVIGLVDIR